MLRTYLFLYPLLAVYILLAAIVFVPLTWVTRDIRPIYWAARQGCRLGFWAAGVRVETIGLERAWSKPVALFVANHVSNLDPPALFAVLPRIAVILKKELGRIPLLGYIMSLGGFIYVDRRARDSRKQALEAGVATLRNGISLLVFPEGTRSPDGKLLPFRPGPFSMAIDAGAAVTPVTVRGARELMPKGTMVLKPGTMQLIFHEPIETAGMSPAERQGLAERVRGVIASAL
jgi:1-acyl-sn-glycerol-3-phosphate acyltransferase